MFRTIARRHKRDRDLPERAWTLRLLRSVIDGTLYDVLPHDFHEEVADSGEYVPLRDRAPSVRYNLCRIVVDDATSLLFGADRFPRIACGDATLAAALNDLARETALADVMTEAALLGSVGSVALLMRVLSGRLYWQPMATDCLTPLWRPEAPGTLASVTERYKVSAADLRARGYAVDDGARTYWFQRVWDDQHETWYEPWPVVTAEREREEPPAIDAERTVKHGLGFVPIVWSRNLPGPSSTGDPADGLCTFRAAIDTQIEIEYQLSQGGRGLKYASDPMLMVREPAAPDEQLVRSGDHALVVGKEGDAKLLEIRGTAIEAVINYARFLREAALESIHGNRADPQRFTAAQSGRALEIMNYGLLGLAGQMRAAYGGRVLVEMLKMALAAAARMPISCNDEELPHAPDAELSLIWPDWYPPTAEERRAEAQTLKTHREAGHMSRETAVGVVADHYDIADAQAELARIAADDLAEDRRLAAQGAQVKAAEPVPE